MCQIGVMKNGYTTTEPIETASRSNGFSGIVFACAQRSKGSR